MSIHAAFYSQTLQQKDKQPSQGQTLLVDSWTKEEKTILSLPITIGAVVEVITSRDIHINAATIATMR